jgi:hypothetical protein
MDMISNNKLDQLVLATIKDNHQLYLIHDYLSFEMICPLIAIAVNSSSRIVQGRVLASLERLKRAKKIKHVYTGSSNYYRILGNEVSIHEED